MPRPARTTTIATNRARCWPEDRFMPAPYLPRRCQNRAGDGFPPSERSGFPELAPVLPPPRPLLVPLPFPAPVPLPRVIGGVGMLGVLPVVRPVPVPAPDQP